MLVNDVFGCLFGGIAIKIINHNQKKRDIISHGERYRVRKIDIKF